MVAAAVAVALIGWFVTPFITKSITAALKYIDESNKSLENVNPNLQKLADQLGQINMVVHKVRLCFIKTGTGVAVGHLWKLKDAINEAEDIMDLFEYNSLKNKPTSSLAEKYTGTKDSPSRLEELVEKLGKLFESAGDSLENWGNIIADYPISYGRIETSPLPENRKNFFRGYVDKHRQLQNLLKGEKNKVIAIIGHGGMGKTHLVRKVFKDNESKFDVRIWVHVYNDLDQNGLFRKICLSAIDVSGSRINVKIDKDTPLTAVESELKALSEPQYYFGKGVNRCLVVLDDVWNREDGFGNSQTQGDEAWKSVLPKLMGLKLCQVVMTTRAKICSTTVADKTIVLDGISDEKMKGLLNDIAKTDKNIAKTEGLPQGWIDKLMASTGKLKGSPRAALSIIENLKTASEDKKRKILDDLNKDHHIGGTYEDHIFTYRHLPLHLQRCLAFCSMFPYNWRFEPEKLTMMWIAHGFIDDSAVESKQPYENLTIEYVAD